MEWLEADLNLHHLTTSVNPSPSPASPPSPLGPLDYLKKEDIKRSFSEFHIKRDATYIAPASMDIKEIYNKFEDPIFQPDLNLEDYVLRYFRACLLHQNDQKVAYIILTEKEYNHLWDNDEIKLTNVDIAMTHGYPNLYQHIHLHQQAIDAINFKITSCVLLGSNEKIDINWKKVLEYLRQNLYLAALVIKVDEPRRRNILRPYCRDKQSTTRV